MGPPRAKSEPNTSTKIYPFVVHGTPCLPRLPSASQACTLRPTAPGRGSNFRTALGLFQWAVVRAKLGKSSAAPWPRR